MFGKNNNPRYLCFAKSTITMSNKSQFLSHLLIFILILIFNSLHSETIVKVIIPNAFSDDENIVSMRGRFEYERDGSLHTELLNFHPESYVGDIMVWSAVVPTMFDVDRIFVGVDINLDSETQTLHDITPTQVEQDGVVTFFRWIFIKTPEMSNLDTNNFEDYFSTSTARVVNVGMEDSLSVHLDVLLGNFFSKYTHVKQNQQMIKKNVHEYTRFISMFDYQNLTKDQIKSKLKTTLLLFFEQIPFYDNFKQFSYECTVDDTGEYLQVDLHLK